MKIDPRLQPHCRSPLSRLRQVVESEPVGGILLMGAAAAALVIANSPLAPVYFRALDLHLFGLSTLHWINDALMAGFFLLVGLEIKRELLVGQLSLWSQRILPGIAALGGMVVPAVIFVAINAGMPETIKGWAISSATDIAFALGVLALLGPRVPGSLKVFLSALAIIDDLGAVLIIALFYTAALSWTMLAASGLVGLALIGLAWRGVDRLWPYLMLGALLWFFVQGSGLHATSAGIILAFTIPLKPVLGRDRVASPLVRLEHGLRPWVIGLIVPIFGFANAGVSFAGQQWSSLLAPLPIGIALGLFLGKQLGVVAFSHIAVGMEWAAFPARATWRHFYGVAVLCGVGFTMSLFVGLLAFPESEALRDQVKFGVLAGSLASAVAGAILLRTSRSKDFRDVQERGPVL